MNTNQAFKTCDLCDQHEGIIGQQLFIAAPIFSAYGGKPNFCGQIVTLKLFEDNSWVKRTLNESGAGKVLVVDGGGSLRCALLGDQLAELAVNNGWQGIVINGCIRDVADINQMPIGVRALACYPLKTVKKDIGEKNCPVSFANVTFHPGMWLYADADGILVSQHALN